MEEQVLDPGRLGYLGYDTISFQPRTYVMICYPHFVSCLQPIS